MHVVIQEKCDYDQRYFAICESCYWTATIFESYRRYSAVCPLCSNDQVALIPLCRNEKFSCPVGPARGLDIEFMNRKQVNKYHEVLEIKGEYTGGTDETARLS